jgi:hypothetical protein
MLKTIDSNLFGGVIVIQHLPVEGGDFLGRVAQDHSLPVVVKVDAIRKSFISRREKRA